MLVRNAEIGDRIVDLRCQKGLILEIADRIPGLTDRTEEEIDAKGGALIPGLHDHHLHLLSLAAHFSSVACGPPDIRSAEALVASLQAAIPSEGWLRGTGYFESVAGALDRTRLDSLFDRHPLRIQHRSGSMWFLNSRAIESLKLDSRNTPAGIERDASGRATGRIFRTDQWLRAELQTSILPDLTFVGKYLASCGVTRVTDATPSNGIAEAEFLSAAQHDARLPQKIRLMGDQSLTLVETSEHFEVAEFKIMLDEPALPDFEELVESIRTAHATQRNVAIHSVTRTEIHFALAAIDAAGAKPGDRLEHASIAPIESIQIARRLGLSIITQPNFIAERGDAYQANVEARDLPHLYRVKSWLDAGVPLAAGTDAPFGNADPWRAIKAATERRTPTGETLGPNEIVSPEVALALFGDSVINGRTRHSMPPTPTASSTPSPLPSVRPSFRSLEIGQQADLCILDIPWRDVRRDLSREHVRATIRSGELIWSAGDST